MGQFARDAQSMAADGLLTGAVLTVHADSGRPDPFSTAHDTRDWSRLDVHRSVSAMAAADKSSMPDNYLLLKANPGSVDWIDDQGWAVIVQHYRVAAQAAQQAGLRGVLVDFEPYTPPFHQFQYALQPGASEHSFKHYQGLARQRGREVMQAIVEGYPKAEVCTFFMLSYLIDDHHHRGPSPVGRTDAQWCLQGHAYGLLPSFVEGWLDSIGPEMRLIDGCENAYWFNTQEQFHECARGVRERGVQLVSSQNREKYRTQVQVAFPIFLDAIHPDLAGRYTLQPEVDDRLGLLRRNLNAASEAGDGLVWLYGEHGRWWPEAGSEALWKGKDSYPHWEQQLPGITAVIRAFRGASRDGFQTQKSDPKTESNEAADATVDAPDGRHPGTALGDKGAASTQPIQPEVEHEQVQEIGATVVELTPTWSTELLADQGSAELGDGQVTITGARQGAGIATIRTDPDRRYMIQVQVVQQGRGMNRLSVKWQTPDGQPLAAERRVVAYPPPGDPGQPRTITAIVRSPPQPHQMRVICTALRQVNDQDIALFGNLLIGLVDESDPRGEKGQ